MHVVVLGCGPAGLTAAWAAVGLGHKVTVVSKAWKPSTLYGCQYLHAPIPGFEDVPRTRVKYQLTGTPEQYRKKVYGNNWNGKVSPEDFVGEHEAWDIRETYRRIFIYFAGMDTGNAQFAVKELAIEKGNIDEVLLLSPDKIISTIPARFLCRNEEHVFARHLIHASGSIIPDDMPVNYVICSGEENTEWYRISNVFGYKTVEWPANCLHFSKAKGAVPVYKPLFTDCDCHPEVIRAGRYGEWKKSVLVHEVYGKVAEALSE